VAGYTRTFLDSGVLITAFSGERDLMDRALAVLEDPNRVFLSSPFIRHEICPKAQFNKRQAEYRFYRAYFQYAQVPGTEASLWWDGVLFIDNLPSISQERVD
jgi:hypothetical protein